MVWLLAAVMAGAVAVALGLPFLRDRAGTAAPAAFDREVYRAQLAEVARDRARGVLSREDADRLRVEIGRKLLEADRGAADVTQGARARPVLALLGVAVMAAGFALYAWLGAPQLPDEPIATRIAAAQKAYDARPSQAEAEAAAPPMPAPPQPDPQYVALVDQLRAAVAKRPDDPRGLALLAENEARMGNIAEALKAQRHLVEVLGSGARAGDHLRLATLMVGAAGGLITREAEDEIARTLQLDPENPQARYMQGMLFAQNGRPDRTFPLWRKLLEDDPEAPWAPAIRGVIGDLAWLAGDDTYVPPGMPGMAALPGPDAAAVAAAGQMSAGDQAQMIAGMVKRLEDRLTSSGGAPEEWARLVNALKVQGNAAHAEEMLARARAAYASDPAALKVIDAAAAQAAPPGPMAGAPALPGPDAAAIAAAGQMSAGDQAQMIAGMVQRLEDRLTSSGGSPEEWARLVNALKVQGNEAHAKEMLARARAAFAGNQDALATIAAAASQAGLE